MANLKYVDSVVDREFRNRINQLIDVVNSVGVSIDELVIKGVMTNEQYSDLITTINGLVKIGEVSTDALSDELKNEIEQINNKVDKGNVSVADINKNLGKIDQTFLSEELLQQIAGTAPVNAVVADGSVTTEKLNNKAVTGDKTDFLVSNNLVTTENIAYERFLFDTNLGATHPQYNHTGYEPVEENTEYEFSFHRLTIFYDSKRNVISVLDDGSDTVKGKKITTPAGTKFLRTNINKDYMSGFYIRKVSSDKYSLNEKFSISNLSILERKNLFDNTSFYANKFINEDGTLVDNTSYNLFLFDDIKENEIYEVNFHRRTVFFDANGNVIDFFTTPLERSVTYFYVPENTAYALIAVEKAVWNSYKLYSKSFNTFSFSDEIVQDDKNIQADVVFQSEWQDKKFVSFGDSITWQDGRVYGGTSDIARGYQTILKEKLGFSEYDNRGVSGVPMANGSANGNGTNTAIKNYTNLSDKDLIIIAAGTNDFKLNVPLGSLGQIGDVDFINTTFFGAYREAIENLLTKKPSLRIVLFTPIQRDNAGYDVNYSNSAGHKLIDYVNAIKEIGEMYGLPVCDMYSNSGITKLNLSLYTLDNLHPNDAGYKRMGGYAAGFINNIGL